MTSARAEFAPPGRPEPGDRSVISSLRGVPWWVGVLLAAVLTAAGTVLDVLRSGTVGVLYGVGLAAGCLLATAWTRRSELFAPMVQPPLLVAVLVPAVVAATGSLPRSGGTVSVVLAVGGPFINGFPAMAVSTTAALAFGWARIKLQRWSRDGGADRSGAPRRAAGLDRPATRPARGAGDGEDRRAAHRTERLSEGRTGRRDDGRDRRRTDRVPADPTDDRRRTDRVPADPTDDQRRTDRVPAERPDPGRAPRPDRPDRSVRAASEPGDRRARSGPRDPRDARDPRGARDAATWPPPLPDDQPARRTPRVVPSDDAAAGPRTARPPGPGRREDDDRRRLREERMRQQRIRAERRREVEDRRLPPPDPRTPRGPRAGPP